MIDRIITASVRHRWAVIAASLALAVLGLWAIEHTPVDAIPDLSEDAVLVFADWPGHAPLEVEAQLSYPLAVELQGLRGVRSVRSSSDFGFSLIHVILDESTPMAEGRRRVAERLAASGARLPEGVVARLGPDAPATGQIYWYTVEGPGHPPDRLRALQDGFIRPQLAAVPGVAEVATVGGSALEFQVALDPGRLRARNVTAGQVVEAIAHANASVGGQSIQKGNAEYLVRGVGTLGGGAADADPGGILEEIRQTLLPIAATDGETVTVGDVASVAAGPGPRRGVLEKDGSETVGGVVLMASGENPLELTGRIKARIHELQAGLPPDVHIVAFYDRTPLIEGAVATVRNTVIEAMITATVCVVLVLLHLRTALVIVLTLPLTVLGSFVILSGLRALGVADIQANVMSLAGIAISIGILVDSSVVMAENVLHRLSEEFGDRPVRGDVRPIVLRACREVGRPIFFSVVIMLLSFLPVFTLRGIEGKMFRPLAFTKTFALLTIAGLSITLVPALCSLLIRGRLRREEDNPLVRSVIEVYRPTLDYCLRNPSGLVWFAAATLVVGLAPVGFRPLLLGALAAGLLAVVMSARTRTGAVVGAIALVLIALAAEARMAPIAREFLTPLDEQMVMDMPITIPRASITQSADDLKARDMVLCRFPEVDMVVGKAGRAETPTDPAPLDMIETMVNFRPREYWPRRVLVERDARSMLAQALDATVAAGLIEPPADRAGLLAATLTALRPRFETGLREFAYLANMQLMRERAVELGHDGHGTLTASQARIWREHTRRLDADLRLRAAELFARLAAEELLVLGTAREPDVRAAVEAIRAHRARPPAPMTAPHHHGGMGHASAPPPVPPVPQLESVQVELAARYAPTIVLWQKDRTDLVGFGSELDRAVQMPGWSNIWTMPIQNRIDMLSTGVNTTIGVRVLGRDLDSVVAASEAIAAALKTVPGAVDVVADPVRGKGYLEVVPDRARAARLGVALGDLNAAVEVALGGKVATTVLRGRERNAVRVAYGRDFREDEQSAAAILVPTRHRDPDGRPRFVALAEVADVRIVEGPATIKGENGMLRNYVRCNLRGRGALDFVAEARRAIAASVALPPGVAVDWTGQFEHEARARRTLLIVIPLVIAAIFAILCWTYRDLADAMLMLLAVPGALAGGVLAQWVSGYPFSVTVWVGYIACFGMATSTGIIMLVYLREAITRAGGLPGLDPESLRRAVLVGACQRLRPKLLTEGITILGLAPLLWADGPGSEILRPMVVPVFGGILIADEFIDLLLPVLFYRTRLRRLTPALPLDVTRNAGRP